MKALVCFASLFFVASAIAEPMHFEVNGSRREMLQMDSSYGCNYARYPSRLRSIFTLIKAYTRSCST